MKKQLNPDWKHILDNFKASGLNARKFAAAQAVNYYTLRYHLNKELQGSQVRQKKSNARIVPLPMPTAPGIHSPTTGSEIKITLEAGAVVIRISGL